jgi:hypothetical protein
VRVANEQEQIDQELGATSGGDPKTEFVKRSQLFRTRGLSLDTSIAPNYALEQALAEMKSRGRLAAGGVRRVAIVGPGLDFADKDVGFDFYPQQTLQPFAVLDTLNRLGLAPAAPGPEIVLLDISPRIVDHVTRARARAGRNIGYTLNLPLPKATPWVPEVRRYWRRSAIRLAPRAGAGVEDGCGPGRHQGRPCTAVGRSAADDAESEHRDRARRRRGVRSRDRDQRLHLLRRARTGAGDVERRRDAEAGGFLLANFSAPICVDHACARRHDHHALRPRRQRDHPRLHRLVSEAAN